MEYYNRKSLALELGIGIETIRYYERKGIIPPAKRDKNGYRIYSHDDLQAIKHVLLAKKYGFSLREIKEATDNIDPNSSEYQMLIKSKIEEIDGKIGELKLLREGLEKLLQTSNPS